MCNADLCRINLDQCVLPERGNDDCSHVENPDCDQIVPSLATT